MENTNEVVNENTNVNEECIELKNIKYKTMLLKGEQIKETKSSNNIHNLHDFLTNEQSNNSNQPWCKLNKTDKTHKIIDFVEMYKENNQLDNDETDILLSFLKDSLNKKKLHRIKDVVYDKTTGKIKEIPGLTYSKMTKHFTLKNLDKRISTVKSLPQKKVQHVNTIKNKVSSKMGSKNVIESENASLENECL